MPRRGCTLGVVAGRRVCERLVGMGLLRVRPPVPRHQAGGQQAHRLYTPAPPVCVSVHLMMVLLRGGLGNVGTFIRPLVAEQPLTYVRGLLLHHPPRNVPLSHVSTRAPQSRCILRALRDSLSEPTCCRALSHNRTPLLLPMEFLCNLQALLTRYPWPLCFKSPCATRNPFVVSHGKQLRGAVRAECPDVPCSEWSVVPFVKAIDHDLSDLSHGGRQSRSRYRTKPNY